MMGNLSASTNEGESAITRFQISWHGNWSDSDIEVSKHLVVKQLNDGA